MSDGQSPIKIANYGNVRPGVGVFDEGKVVIKDQPKPGGPLEPVIQEKAIGKASLPGKPNQAQAQPKPPEAPSTKDGQEEAPKEEVPKGPTMEERLEAMERRERALVKQLRSLREQKEEQPKEDGKLTAAEWAERFKQNPEEVGVTYEEMVDIYGRQPETEGDRQVLALQKQIAALEERLQKADEAQQNRQSEAYQNAKKQLSREVGRLVEDNQDFALIGSSHSQNLVVDYIEKVYQEEGELISVEEAAKEVEDALLEQAASMAKLEKVRKQIGENPQGAQSQTAPEKEASETPTEQKIPARAGGTTLSNRLIAESRSRTLTRYERAILRAEGVDPDSL